MKKLLFVVALILYFAKPIFCQDLNIKFVEQLTKIKISEIDYVMIEGYGYKKYSEENEGRQITFTKVLNDDLDNAIMIELIFPKNNTFSINIKIAKNFSIQKIKDDLIKNNYLFEGEQMGGLRYKKENIVFLISIKPISMGCYQILVLGKNE